MTLKRQSILVGLGYAAFLTILDIVGCLFGAHSDPSTNAALWSPVTAFIILSFMLPQPPRPSLRAQLRKPKNLALLVCIVVSCVVTLRYFSFYSRAIADFGVLLGLWFALKQVPKQDIPLDSGQAA